MRFVGTIGDTKAVDVFNRVVGVVAKLSKKRCVVRITPTEFSFVTAYNIREGMHMDFRIHKDHLFTSWNYRGISADNDAIFLELPNEDLHHSLHSHESQVKLKIVKKDQVPYLRIELIQNAFINEIPFAIVTVKQWADFNPPDMGVAQLAVSLPSIKILTRIICGMKDIGAKVLMFRANTRGEFNIIAHGELAKIAVYAQGLANQTMSGDSLSQTVHQSDHFFSVALDIRPLYAFISSVHSFATRLTMRIVEDQGAVFVVREPECSLTLYLAGINTE